jgi:hypothetical protein
MVDGGGGLPLHRGKAKRDPSAGLRHRRRPQDDDAQRTVRDAEFAEKTQDLKSLDTRAVASAQL